MTIRKEQIENYALNFAGYWDASTGVLPADEKDDRVSLKHRGVDTRQRPTTGAAPGAKGG